MVKTSQIVTGVITGLATTGVVYAASSIFSGFSANDLEVNVSDLSIDGIDGTQVKFKVAALIKNRLTQGITLENPTLILEYFQNGQFHQLASNNPGLNQDIEAKSNTKVWIPMTTSLWSVVSALGLSIQDPISSIIDQLKNTRMRTTFTDHIAGFNIESVQEFGPGAPKDIQA